MFTVHIYSPNPNPKGSIMSTISKFFKDEAGVTAAEYALILSLIALVVIAGATTLGTTINTKLSTAATTITPAA